jgi:hypothetical protein
MKPSPASPSELDALLSAIAEAIDALAAWDHTAFDSAVERQRAICQRLRPGALLSPEAAATARKVRELNRVYARLLQHSRQWTRTLHAIFEAGGHTLPSHASVHFRG